MTNQTACREAFEKWAIGEGYSPELVGDEYKPLALDNAWQGWQAAWNTRAPESEAVAWKCVSKHGIFAEFCDEEEVAEGHKLNGYTVTPLYTHPRATSAEVERDAARYRWLRDKSVHFELPDRGTPYCVYGLGMGDSNPTWGTELDAMVDYCMSLDTAIAKRGEEK